MSQVRLTDSARHRITVTALPNKYHRSSIFSAALPIFVHRVHAAPAADPGVLMRAHWSGVLTGFASALMLCASPLIANSATAPNFAPDRSDPTALRCDQLADSPGDPSRVGSGVEFSNIN